MSGEIAWYVNKIHVGTPDAEVAAEIGELCEKAGWDPLPSIGAMAYAVNCHRANRAEYRAVVGASLSSLPDSPADARRYGSVQLEGDA